MPPNTHKCQEFEVITSGQRCMCFIGVTIDKLADFNSPEYNECFESDYRDKDSKQEAKQRADQLKARHKALDRAERQHLLPGKIDLDAFFQTWS